MKYEWHHCPECDRTHPSNWTTAKELDAQAKREREWWESKNPPRRKGQPKRKVKSLSDS